MKMTVVLPSGNAEERERAQRLANNIPDAIVAPPLAIRELSGLLAGAKIVVGVDTGLTHLAAALNKPTVAIFAGSDPDLTGVHAGPLAVNVGRNRAPPTADEVQAVVKRLLK